MGWGDEIMVTAQARRMQLKDPRPVAVRGINGWARFHPIWDNNPRIFKPGVRSTPASAVQWLDNYSGRRPYLDYSKFRNSDRAQAYVYTDFRVEPGEIYLTPAERELGRAAAGVVILEPNIKPGASRNKDWGWTRWQRLADLLRREGLRLAQIGPRGTPVLHGVEWIRTDDVRQAAAMVAQAELLVVPEGGLHHCAAALGKRAVVIFGGFISPATTGYDLHVNLFTGGKACGMRVPCPHCARAMEAIEPEGVAGAALGLQLELGKVAA